MESAWRHEFRVFIIEHASFIFLNQEGLWILQTVSVEFLPPATRGRMLSAHHNPFQSQLWNFGALSQRLHIGTNDITNPAHFGVAIDFVDASPFLAKTLL